LSQFETQHLQNNGGPTQTVALLAGSNTINGAAAACLDANSVPIPLINVEHRAMSATAILARMSSARPIRTTGFSTTVSKRCPARYDHGELRR